MKMSHVPYLSLFLIQFTFFNNFAVLFHIAFFKEDLPLLRKVGIFSETVLAYNPKISINTISVIFSTETFLSFDRDPSGESVH